MSAVAVDLDREQRGAVAHALDGPCLAILGAPGTGKSVALVRRAMAAIAVLTPDERAIATAASDLGVARVRAALGESASGARLFRASLGEIAFSILESHRFDLSGSPDVALVDDVRAQEVFSEAAGSLYALEWDEFVSAELDPEITGLRAPERFARTAYRLIRKLRMAGFSPEAFARAALRKATAFYGHPPNFASPDLIEKTPAKHRASLFVGREEIARQHAREVDLIRIVARLYESYLERLSRRGCLTPIDALAEAAQLLERRADVRESCARTFRYAFVDDAQDLTRCDVRFLWALFGDHLERVTLAGDCDQRTLAFSGPREDGLLEAAPHRYVLERQFRSTLPILQAARTLIAGGPASPASGSAVTLHRAESIRGEAAFVADAVARAVAEGVPPAQIAVIVRSLRCADPYLSALLERDVPVDPCGEASLYGFADVEDALAALWSVADPYRHDWLLRNLEAPWLALSDASIAALCGDPAEAQAALFELPAEAEDERGRRWDRRRDVRLSWNVLRGDRDGELTPVARERLLAFRRARRSWLAEAPRLSTSDYARRILADTFVAEAPLGARARLRRGLVARLSEEIEAFVARHSRATLRDYLEHAERVAAADDFLRIDRYDAQAIALLDVEAAKGREFACVFVVDTRAGAFPRYYVPDSFGFTPRLGMIARENVGDAAVAPGPERPEQPSQTAKFTYFQSKYDVRALYNAEERRALYCAMTRARERLSISTSGRPTRGRSAPEFFEELRGLAEGRTEA